MFATPLYKIKKYTWKLVSLCAVQSSYMDTIPNKLSRVAQRHKNP